MSSRPRPDTRTAVLLAARRLLEERGYHGVGLEEIAKAAGVSRQAVYLHFGSKAELLLQLARHIDESQGLAAFVRAFQEAGSALEAVDRLIHAHATYGPRVLRIALVMDGARRSEPDAVNAWRERMMSRLWGIRSVVERLAGEGILAEGWTIDDASEWWWALSSPQAQELLVDVRGWSPERYETVMRRAVRSALVDTSARATRRREPAPTKVGSTKGRAPRARR